MAACHTGLERLLIILILFQWILSWNLPQEKKMIFRKQGILMFLQKLFLMKILLKKEILELANLGLKHGIEIILQPKMPMSKNLDAAGIFQKLYNKYSRIRLIPQVHKYLNLP